MGQKSILKIYPKNYKGDKGDPVEFRLTASFLQWKWVNSETWIDLCQLSEIQGPVGPGGLNGTDGKEIELQKGVTYIQWRYVGESWVDLILISSLKGDQGDQGIQGIQGLNGINGIDGKDVELRTNSGYIQWRIIGGTWENLILLNDLKGADGYTPIKGVDYFDGTNGTDGADGYTPIKGVDYNDGVNGLDGSDGTEIELQNTGTYIQWRYVGGSWTNLVELINLKGDTGDKGDKGEPGDVSLSTALALAIAL